MSDTVYFISDAHLGIDYAGCERREENLILFLRSLPGKAAKLFIVGDLFDFWIEYTHAIQPRYFATLHELRNVITQGVEVHYLAGNHDFALGPFLERTLGIHIYRGHLELTMQGKRVHLFHGDGLLHADFMYRIWRAVLRNPVNQKLYKLLHPDIGIGIATFCSLSSRHVFYNTLTEKKLAEYARAARGYLDRGADIMILAHTHRPELHEYDGKFYCNTGEWMRRYTYAILENGGISLWEYFPGKQPERIEPVRHVRK
jgi:UDP-2,3-diacylglucosamine hydrolase